MKKLLIAVACAMALAGCSTTYAPGTTPVVSAQETVLDERALFTAEAAYNVAATAYLAAAGRDQLPAAAKAQARAVLVRSYDALKLARSAYAVGDAATFAAQISAATAFATHARAVLTPD